MRRTLSTAGLAVATCALSGCLDQTLDQSPHAAGLKQLVVNDFACTAKPERIPVIQSEFGDPFTGASGTFRDQAWQAMSVIPREYLGWVLERNQVPIELRQTNGSTRGMTTSRGINGDWWPSEIWVAPQTGNFNALPHEVGHATQHYVNKTFPKMKAELGELFTLTAQNGEGTLMRGYARSSETEFFAEIFDSYYCSQESRAYMANKFPKTLAFARKYLIDPDRLDTGSSGTATEAGLAANVDEDNDQVSNPYDKCLGSVDGATVSFAKSDYGCSTAQLAGSDQDGDGIADAADRCPNTPANANVWQETTGPNAVWLGCAADQTPS